MQASDLIMNGEIVLEGEIVATGYEEYFEGGIITAAMVRKALAHFDGGDVTLRVNSPGGDPTEGEAIRAMLAEHPGKVSVVVSGDAMSAASLMIMGADHIAMTAGSILMIHDPSSITLGTAEDHEKSAQMLNVLADTYAGVYAARSGKSVEEMRALMKAETFMGPQEALDAGFIDAIAEPAKATAEMTAAMASQAQARMDAGLARLSVAMKAAGKNPTAAGGHIKADMAATKEADMPDPKTPAETTPDKAVQPQMAKPDAKEMDAVRMAERQRCQRIRSTVKMSGLDEGFADELIDQGVTVDKALDMILAKQAEAPKDAPKMQHRAPARVTVDGRDKFVEGVGRAIMAKVGLDGGERNEFSSMALVEIARESIKMAGERPNYGTKMELLARAFTMPSMSGAHSTSDFANILADVMNKSALKGWEEAEETYQRWTSKGTLTDFRPSKRVGLGLFDALPEVAEGAEYTYGTIGDRGESITLATYGRIIKLTRQAMINDSAGLDLLGSIPRKHGRAARSTVGNLAYAVLTGNPNMSDGTALFHADHNNLAGSAAAPSVTSLGSARTAMKTQKEAAGKSALNIRPAYAICPAALETSFNQLINSTVDPTATKGHATNPVAGMVEVIADARLDDASATAWYLAANPSAFDTVEVAYLDGIETPWLEEQTGWNSDGVEMKVRIDAGVAPLDFRGLYKNAGS